MLPSIERIREAFAYSPESGQFRWKIKPRGVLVGGLAGSISKSTGYLVVCLDYGRIYGHKLAWAHVHGEWPENGIDHINGNRADNRLSNLRLASRADNCANQTVLRSDNKSGYRGVRIYQNTGRWIAGITRHGRPVHLGYFKTRDEAVAAYDAAARKLFGEFYPGQPQTNQMVLA